MRVASARFRHARGVSMPVFPVAVAQTMEVGSVHMAVKLLSGQCHARRYSWLPLHAALAHLTPFHCGGGSLDLGGSTGRPARARRFATGQLPPVSPILAGERRLKSPSPWHRRLGQAGPNSSSGMADLWTITLPSGAAAVVHYDRRDPGGYQHRSWSAAPSLDVLLPDPARERHGATEAAVAYRALRRLCREDAPERPAGPHRQSLK